MPAAARAVISTAAESEASRLSGELRCEPHCLQVLGEAMRALRDFVEDESDDNEFTVEAAAAVVVAGGGASLMPSSSVGDSNSPGRGTADGRKMETSVGVERRREAFAPSDTGGGQQIFGRPGKCPRAGGMGAEGGKEGGGILLGRRLIYSHHIIAPQKRTGIVKAAKELGLGGFSKVG